MLNAPSWQPFVFSRGGGATAVACFCSPTGCWTGSDDAAVAAVVDVVAVHIPQCFAVERWGCGIRPEWERCESDPEAASSREKERQNVTRMFMNHKT